MIQRLLRVPVSKKYQYVDAIVPALNEEPCLEQALINLLRHFREPAGVRESRAGPGIQL
jgi:hypothetical protein